MKTFKSLKFKPHELAVETGNHDYFGTRAEMHFKNGYGVSVVCGKAFYSNGVDTYEVAVLKDGVLCYRTPITSDVLSHQTSDDVTDVMKQVQSL